MSAPGSALRVVSLVPSVTETLLAWGVTAAEVSQQLARFQVERPGGKAEIGGEQQTIRTVGTSRARCTDRQSRGAHRSDAGVPDLSLGPVHCVLRRRPLAAVLRFWRDDTLRGTGGLLPDGTEGAWR